MSCDCHVSVDLLHELFGQLFPSQSPPSAESADGARASAIVTYPRHGDRQLARLD